MGRVTLAVFLLSLSMAKADELRTARELKELGPAKMAQGMPARILGVVTSIRGSEFPEFTLQDETGGVVAHLDGPVGERVKVGQRVEIEGTTDEKPPSPRLDVRKLTVHEMVGLPAPIQVNPADLRDGSMDCQYVEFPGVIRKVVTEENIPPIRLILDFGLPDQRLSVWVSHFNEQHEKRLQPDAEVRVRGVCNSWRRLNHQPSTPLDTVANPDGIGVVVGQGHGGGEGGAGAAGSGVGLAAGAEHEPEAGRGQVGQAGCATTAATTSRGETLTPRPSAGRVGPRPSLCSVRSTSMNSSPNSAEPVSCLSGRASMLLSRIGSST